jgi:phage protein U
MLMAWGPFRFTVPTYSVEAIQRSVQPRIEAAAIIQGMPSLHRLGPGNPTISLQSTFHPHHLNGRGLAQLNGVREAVNAMVAFPLCAANGGVFGMWVATSMNDEQQMFDAKGTPATVQTTLELMQDGGGSMARMIAGGVVASLSFSIF